MVEAIKMIGSDIGWQTLAILFCLIVTGLPAVIKGIDYLIDRFGIETKGSKQRKEQSQKCAVQAAAIKALEDKIAEYNSSNIEHWNTSKSYQSTYAQNQQDIIDQLSSIAESVNALQKKMDENELQKQIEKYRDKIFNFASNLNSPHFNPEKDHYDNIFEVYNDYENLLHTNGLTNGQCEASMNVIRKHFECDVDAGKFADVI